MKNSSLKDLENILKDSQSHLIWIISVAINNACVDMM